MNKPMNILIVLGKSIGLFLEIFIALMSFYILLFIWGMIFYTGSLSDSGDVTIFVRSNGVHTEICMPVKTDNLNWLNVIPIDAYEDTSQTEFIAIGWGDKGFFLDTPTWAELKTSTALTAVFLPSPTAMHVQYGLKPIVSDVCKKVQISSAQYQKLCNYIEGSFDKKEGAVQLIPGHGYWMTDNFYEAKGTYHLFRTCNVWTNNGLKSANIRTSLFSPFPEGNLIHL
ncbi:MAG: hypothetical protein ACI865_002990 [Flavobacteriaceae bacterium]|jgi:uncharacterized protein (TIGR02117 family)